MFEAFWNKDGKEFFADAPHLKRSMYIALKNFLFYFF